MMEILEGVLHTLVHVSTACLNLAGLAIIVISAVQCLVRYFGAIDELRLEFSRRIALGLEFLLAGEILHTITAEDYHDLIVLGAIVVFRFILTWEVGKEERELEEKLHENTGHHE